MSLQEIYRLLSQNIHDALWQEWVSTGMQIISVWYARKNNVLVYPTGIFGVLLAAWLYFFIATPPLYADGFLNIYFFGMSIYGWYNWSRKKDVSHFIFPISWCNKKEITVGLFVFFISWILLFLILSKLTNSNVPILDSLVSSTAITAMWWMAKRKIENWLAWILSNLVAIPLNFYKQFYLFTLMYILFLVMAIWGFVGWKKIIKNA